MLARNRAELAALQRATLAVVTNPLTRTLRTARRLRDGRSTAQAAAALAKGNDRLNPVERLEIYNRMYWFRTLDSLHEDCPTLRAILGERRFLRLAEAFLLKHPSHYWTLRDLPERLADFIRRTPRLTRPHTALCADTARFEWAQIQAYDSAALTPLTTAALATANPARLKLRLQPHVQLLALRFPVDDFVIAIRQREALLRGDASNAPTGLKKSARRRRVALPKPSRMAVAIHRHEGKIYFKRLEPAALQILTALAAGQPLARALAAGMPRTKRAAAEIAARVQEWFSTWMQLGWLCPR